MIDPAEAQDRSAKRTQHIVIDAEHFDHTMGLLLQALEDLRNAQPAAFATALGSVLTDRALVGRVMDTVADVTQERATRAAGRGVWWLLKSGLSRWLVIIVIVFLVARAAGWDAAKAVLRILGPVS